MRIVLTSESVVERIYHHSHAHKVFFSEDKAIYLLVFECIEIPKH